MTIRILTAVYRDIYGIENPSGSPNFRKILESFRNRKYISRKTI